MEYAVQILRQCEDLVKLKIQKDEDNSGGCPKDHAQRPAARKAGGRVQESPLPTSPCFRVLGNHYRAPQSVRSWQDIGYLSGWLVPLLQAAGLGLAQQRQTELVSWEAGKRESEVGSKRCSSKWSVDPMSERVCGPHSGGEPTGGQLPSHSSPPSHLPPVLLSLLLFKTFL